MDIRITHFCNSNCLYCLEQEYRKKEKFIDTNILFHQINDNFDKTVLNFYGWNPLLHPDLIGLVLFGKKQWYKNISLLTNTLWLTIQQAKLLKFAGVTSMGVYFYSFHFHDEITQIPGSFKEWKKNIVILKKFGIPIKYVIHLNAMNIDTLSQDVEKLIVLYGAKQFEFVNYFPFDRPYDDFHDKLWYDVEEKRPFIQSLFQMIEKYKVNARFQKFDKNFFWDFESYYDFENTVKKHISQEDYERISWEKPVCLDKKRCKSCFIKDDCKHYEKTNIWWC